MDTSSPSPSDAESAPDATTTPLKVLSVVGPGRSGSTILAAVLAEVEGVAAAGELRWLWERGVIGGRPCACGRPPLYCPVWAPVVNGTRTLDSIEGRGPNESRLVQDQHDVARVANRLRLLRNPRGTLAESEPLRRVRSATGAALRGLARELDARVVIDISKRPIDAAIVAGIRGVEHYVVHIVRDPRAVVQSWRRAKTFTVAGETRTMGTRRVPASISRWTSNCVDAELLRRHMSPDRWLEMRYEDFADDPAATMGRILELLEFEGPTPDFNGRAVTLRPNHMVAGNPSRFTTGVVTIRPDVAWKKELSTWNQRMVQVATYPLMIRYGYNQAAGLAKVG